MQEPHTWRELLGNVIDKPKERQRIADQLGVSPITLVRWVTGTSNPRSNHLQLLLDTLPQYREPLSELLAQEYVGFLAGSGAKKIQEAEDIPSAFYARILDTYTSSPSNLRSTSILALVVQQMLGHFDPENSLGIQVIVAQCISPNEQYQYVRSLRIIMQQGTSLWSSQEQRTMLMGAESLIGYAVASGHLVVEQDLLMGQSLFPFPEKTIERSAVACPLLLEDRLAGCVMVSSTQPNYFTSFRLSLIASYAQLLVLAFDGAEFYPLNMIQLGIMPPYPQQQPHLQLLQASVRKHLFEAAQQRRMMTRIQAETIVWKELEQKLLEMPSD